MGRHRIHAARGEGGASARRAAARRFHRSWVHAALATRGVRGLRGRLPHRIGRSNLGSKTPSRAARSSSSTRFERISVGRRAHERDLKDTGPDRATVVMVLPGELGEVFALSPGLTRHSRQLIELGTDPVVALAGYVHRRWGTCGTAAVLSLEENQEWTVRCEPSVDLDMDRGSGDCAPSRRGDVGPPTRDAAGPSRHIRLTSGIEARIGKRWARRPRSRTVVLEKVVASEGQSVPGICPGRGTNGCERELPRVASRGWPGGRCQRTAGGRYEVRLAKINRWSRPNETG